MQPTATAPPPPTVTGIVIGGVGASGTAGDQLNLSATAMLSDQSTLDVSSQTTWESSNPGVANVAAGGRLTMIAAGECEVRASYAGVTGTMRVVVTPRAPDFGTIAGVVSDSDTGGPVVGARVEVVGGQSGGRFSPTDGNGYYSIGGVLNGPLTTRVTRDGYVATEVQTTVAGNTRFDIRLRPLPPPPYVGTYNVSLSVSQDTCGQVVPAASGQVQLSGTTTTVTVRIIERGITRSYNGTIAGDGTFAAANANGTTSGSSWMTYHVYSGTITGRVTGNSISGTERLNFTSGCPGQLLVLTFGGSK